MDEKARGKFFIERMICEAGCFAFLWWEKNILLTSGLFYFQIMSQFKFKERKILFS